MQEYGRYDSVDESERVDETKGAETKYVRGILYEDPFDAPANVNNPAGTQEMLVKGVTYDLIPGLIYDDNVKNESTQNSENVKQDTGVGFMENQNKNICSPIQPKGKRDKTIRTTPIVKADSLNFKLQLLAHVIRKFDTEKGEQEEFAYHIGISVHLYTGKVREYTALVESSKVKGVDWLKRSTHCLATIPKNKMEQEEYQEKIQRCIETEGVPEEIIYSKCGWNNVPGYGWRYVYGNGFIGARNCLVHTAQSTTYDLDFLPDKIDKSETFYQAMEMQNICRSRVASTELFLYVHTSLLAELFKIAGHPLNFAFGVLGVTNSRKTSLVTTMARIFDRQELVAHAEFATATDCGIEKILSTFKDAPVIVDDFKPGINQAEQRKLSGKLDSLLRLCGNHVPKKRMNDFVPEGNKKFFPIEGGCVLTLEVVDGVLSSLTRLFVTELTADEVVNEKLGFFQSNIWILPTHVYSFLLWVTTNFDSTLQIIRNNFPQFRIRHNFEKGRFADMYATFMITAFLVAYYAKDLNFWNNTDQECFIRETEKIILQELRNMESRVQNWDKGYYSLNALVDILTTGLIQPPWLNENTCKNRYKVYQNEKFIFVQVKYLRTIVNEYSRNHGDGVEIINDDELLGLLERLQVIDIVQKDGKRERSRKLPIQRGNTLRYLYIKKYLLEQQTDHILVNQ